MSNNEISKKQNNTPADGGVFSGIQAFEGAQRMATALATSSLVPADYKGNTANTLIALEMAQRTGSSPMAVMQNMHIIHGRPSWSSQFVIAALNSCGLFSPVRFRVEGDGDGKTCVAWAYDKATNDVLEGPAVSIAMAKAEGWYSKNGSKWKTMPDLMLRYRAAKFFGNLYAPHITMGMLTAEESGDVAGRQAMPNSGHDGAPAAVSDLNAAVIDAEPVVVDEPAQAAETLTAPPKGTWNNAEPMQAEPVQTEPANPIADLNSTIPSNEVDIF